MRLAQDIYDELGVLLLAAGMRITPRFLQLLSQRKIRTVQLRSAPATNPAGFDFPEIAEPAGLAETRYSRQVEEWLEREVKNVPRFQPVRAWRRPRVPTEVLKSEADKGLERHAAVSGAVSEIGETLQLGGKVAVGNVRASLHSFLNMVTLDFDLLPLIVSLQRTRDEYLFDHAVNVALLAMTIGAQLGLNQDQLTEIALGGMLNDIGMLRVPGRIRLAPRPLTPTETLEVRRHPFHTLELLEGVRGLPAMVRMIAYQVHERLDGSGYPRGYAGALVHPFAMIVGVADMYAAITRPRPYRPAVSPYEAARTVLMEAGQNKFDRNIVRAFLDTVALCPIGSVVELSDGRRGMVLRANPNLHTRPVVEELDEHNHPNHRIIDLSKEEGLTVVRAYPDQVRPESALSTR
jgi:HD-GYP domain-containing protein (c-di-GMP phosphodiesterase class II)